LSEHPLDRTVLLLQRDVFGEMTRDVAIEALMGTRVRLTADPDTMRSPAGQTAVIASFITLAQMGLRVVLDVPDAPVIGRQPPFDGGSVGEQLEGLATRLVQPCASGDARPDLVVAIGASPGGQDAVRVTGTDWAAALRRGGQGIPWTGTLPFGAALAAVSVGAVALRCVVQRLEAELGIAAPIVFRHVPLPMEMALPPVLSGSLDVGDVDVISAGAITNAALFVLLRVPGIRGLMRVFDADIAELPNLNRYPLLDRRQIGAAKARSLERFGHDGMTIASVEERFDATAEQLPLAPRVLVGVDHIPSRWKAQAVVTGWLHVAATSHFEVMSTAHEQGGPCAGCAHSRDDEDDGDIPTISFVSLLAGTLQAHALLSHAAGTPVPSWFSWPLNLGGRSGLERLDPGPSRECPVGCQASLAMRSIAA